MCAVHSLVYFSEQLPLVLEAEVEVSASFNTSPRGSPPSGEVRGPPLGVVRVKLLRLSWILNLPTVTVNSTQSQIDA